MLLDLPEPVPSVSKGLFGLEQLADNADFADTIHSPLGAWTVLPLFVLFSERVQ
jgi:hypothetical protein